MKAYLLAVLPLVLSAACGKSSNNPVTTVADCTTYCAQANSNCKNPNTSDIDISTSCATTCARFPTTGTEGDTSGDTVQCRLHYSGTPAQTNAATACPDAGVSGNNVCGTWCDVMCREAIDNCTGSNVVYASQSACQSACAGFATTGKPGDTSGNTVQCRIYHLNVAGTSAANATEHCPHGAVNSAPCT